ncbi:hypothetical protein AB0I60_14705 [Actinosynnema sp. NPDC050436]|uniref:hypothetical protein n=1 Tax=Actinosynnema sp. NPDC050436 TaxID=3155659 RepID=UPI0033DF92E8
MRRARGVLGVIVLAATTWLAGCGSAELSGEVTEADLETLHAAEQVLMRDCMKRAGFDYTVAQLHPVPDDRQFPYVIDDVAWARAHGYGGDIQRQLSSVKENEPNRRYFDGLSTARKSAYLNAANGQRAEGITATSPEGTVYTRSDRSCTSKAEEALYGDAQAWFQARVTTDALVLMRHDEVKADPRFAEAVVPWSTCMTAAGHAFGSPQELRAGLPPDAVETALAVAEATCAVDSGLAARLRELDEHHRIALEDRFRSDVDNQRQMRLEALPRARDITAGS